jgi:hypothetical protein
MSSTENSITKTDLPAPIEAGCRAAQRTSRHPSEPTGRNAYDLPTAPNETLTDS